MLSFLWRPVPGFSDIFALILESFGVSSPASEVLRM
jgi:hypothetical protein